MTIEKLHQLFLSASQVCTDTRNISANSIFFALKGANFNGNSFALEALQKGASYAVVDEEEFATSEQTILVDDVLLALQELGSYHRNAREARIIALTGSNGKTTTKELIHAVLSKKYNTVATKGNLNNHIGVPLTLLSIKKETQLAIVEMGANHLGEIAFLCGLAQPDFGYITNFGKAHLEGFGSEEGVIRGKCELYDYLIANNRHVFLNADDPIQDEKLSNYVRKFGFSRTNPKYYNIALLEADPFVCLKTEGMRIQTQLIGSYNFDNCCAALLIGKYFNVSDSDIKAALEHYVPKNNRSQLLKKKGHTIILDAYNANPTSMLAALENFHSLKSVRKIAFLGDMFELGETAIKEHQAIAELVSKYNFDEVFLIGANFSETTTSLKKFASFEALSSYLKENKLQKSSILIKGSRGMALERILELL